jgi:hypothetical protein
MGNEKEDLPLVGRLPRRALLFSWCHLFHKVEGAGNGDASRVSCGVVLNSREAMEHASGLKCVPKKTEQALSRRERVLASARTFACATGGRWFGAQATRIRASATAHH